MNPYKYAPSRYDITDLMRRRFSPVGFFSAPVDNDDLFALLEAAIWSPAELGAHVGRYVVGIHGVGDTHARILATLRPETHSWAQRAPVLAIAATVPETAAALHALGTATAMMALEATARGLYLHATHAFDADAAVDEFAIPQPYRPIVALAIGHLAAPESLEHTLRERDTQARTRPDPQDIAFSTTWGRPIAVNPDDDGTL